jgi:transposase
MSNSFLGIDISKEKFDVHLIGDQETWSGQFDNSSQGFKQLQKWLKKRRVDQLHACMEATGSYGEELAYFLHEQGYLVSVVNPKIIKHYGLSKMQRNKTDKLDAKLIAQYCQKEGRLVWRPPSEAERTLRALTRRLDALTANRTREKNRLTAQTHPDAVKISIEETIAFYGMVQVSLTLLLDTCRNFRAEFAKSPAIPGACLFEHKRLFAGANQRPFATITARFGTCQTVKNSLFSTTR